MSNLSYSNAAINIRNRFYNCDKIVYVEGNEDILFWEIIFKKIKLLKVEIESAGGSPELDKIIKKIDTGELDVIVARDSDYKRILGESINNDNVIYTFGYSIENSLYTSDAVRRITRIWCRGENTSPQECQKWFDDFIQSIEELIYYDLANYMTKSSLLVLGDNCSRFMKSLKSSEVDRNKVQSYIDDISKTISPEEVKCSIELLENSSFVLIDMIKGHFLTSAILKYINSVIRILRKSISVSYEALYANIIQAFESTFDDKHPHYNHYLSSLDACFKSAQEG